MNTTDTQNSENTSRPFGYWLKATDRLMADAFRSAFEDEEAGRRDWRILNVVDGTVPARRPLNAHKLHDLVDRGWVIADGDGWALTDEGRAAKERLGAIVDGIRSKVTDAVSPDDLATTLASLEKIARAFGWDEETPLPRGRGGRGFGFGGRHGHPFGHGRDEERGFGRGFGRRHGGRFGRNVEPGFGHEGDHGHARHADFGHGAGHGFGPQADFTDAGCRHDAPRHGGHPRHHGHPGHPGHPHGEQRTARAAQHAFERGFDAGYSRGRDA